MRNTLDQKTLRSLVDYDPETGIVVWRKRPEINKYAKAWNTRYAGQQATCLRKGYLQISITLDSGEKYAYPIHRLAWLYVYGEFPDGDLDHEDRVKTNNRIKNLRPSTVSLNGHNVGLTKRNKSGVKGVNWHKASNKWIVRIATGGKVSYLGTFSDLEDAKAAYAAASMSYAKEFSIFSKAA